MTNHIEVSMRWDLDQVPAGQHATRGLLIDVCAASTSAPVPEERLPVNLALVLDRSGSMAGMRLDAAVQGTLGVLDSLSERDRLSVVAFDDEALVLASGQAMTNSARMELRSALNALESRGSTDLARGWHEGAGAAALVLETTGRRGHVVVLSDGRANKGIIDARELGIHAAGLAAREVTSSAVGIGSRYSPLQLDAIAEHGGGRLHHCDHHSDIVDVILSELGEAREVAATNVELRLRWPQGVALELLNDFPATVGDGELRIELGNLRRGLPRSIALMIAVAPRMEGERLPFDVQMTWSTAAGSRGPENYQTVLHVVPRNACNDSERVEAIADRIVDLWEARLVYRATTLNEQGSFAQAVELMRVAERVLAPYAHGLPAAISRARNREQLTLRLQGAWEGISKRSTMDVSKKLMRSEADPRRIPRGDWSDEMRK